MTFRLVPKSVTLNDFERRNGPYLALFHRIFVYDVVVKQLLGLPRDQNLLLIFCDHINTICAIIQRLFYKTRGDNSLHFRLQLPMPMSPDEFLVALGRSIVQHSGLDGRVHVKTRFDGQVRSVDAQQKLGSRFNGRRRWPLQVRCRRKKFTFAISYPDEFLVSFYFRRGSIIK